MIGLRTTLGLALTGFLVSIAHAADFSFRIPLDLQNLHPSVQKIGYACQVYDDKNFVQANGQYSVIDLAGKHSFQGTVTYELNYNYGKSDGRIYYCRVIFYTTGGSVQPGQGSDPAALPKPGTAFSPVVQGKIP